MICPFSGIGGADLADFQVILNHDKSDQTVKFIAKLLLEIRFVSFFSATPDSLQGNPGGIPTRHGRRLLEFGVQWLRMALIVIGLLISVSTCRL